MQGGASQLCSKMGPVGSWKLTDFPDRSVRVIIVPDLFDAVVQMIVESVTKTFDSHLLPCANNVQRETNFKRYARTKITQRATSIGEN